MVRISKWFQNLVGAFGLRKRSETTAVRRMAVGFFHVTRDPDVRYVRLVLCSPAGRASPLGPLAASATSDAPAASRQLEPPRNVSEPWIVAHAFEAGERARHE